MSSAERGDDELPAEGGPAAHWLESLIPIAVVIGAGCEACTRSLILRARGRGISAALITRTLAVVARVSSAECLARAVGPEVVGRMRASLEAGQNAVPGARGRVGTPGCCGIG
jgi:hypothetical protein